MLHEIRQWYRRRKYTAGRTISGFIAKDVRRDVRVISIERIHLGLITCQIRTWNVLYESSGFAREPDFESPAEVKIDDLWKWPGQSWGGLPNGKSIANQTLDSTRRDA